MPHCDEIVGARLFIVARTTEKLEEVKESCEKLGSPEVTVIEADMLQENDLARISEAVSSSSGRGLPPPVHALPAGLFYKVQ